MADPQSTSKKSLSIDQCKILLKATRGNKEYSLFLSLLVAGRSARQWTWAEVTKHALDMPIQVWNALAKWAVEKNIVISPFNYSDPAHWIAGPHLQDAVWTFKGGQPLTTQEVTRRVKNAGQRAGLGDISMRTLGNTHMVLMAVFGDVEKLAEELGASSLPSARNSAAQAKPALGRALFQQDGRRKVGQDPRLHGIGRRSKSLVR